MSYLYELRKLAAVAVVVYVAMACGLFIVMHRPVLFSKVMRHVPDPTMAVFPFKEIWFLARVGGLKIGDPAPGFNLPAADQHSFVSLASFHHQRPVVLVFGSYT